MLTSEKVAIVCVLPPSLTSKSFAVRSVTTLPCASVTLASSSTSSTPDRKVGCAGAGCCGAAATAASAATKANATAAPVLTNAPGGGALGEEAILSLILLVAPGARRREHRDVSATKDTKFTKSPRRSTAAEGGLATVEVPNASRAEVPTGLRSALRPPRQRPASQAASNGAW